MSANTRPARENQDTACLNFALSWLLYLRQAHNLPSASSLRSLAALAGDGGSEQDELAFLKAKAKDGKHWSLVSSTLLEEAKLELRHVCSFPPRVECRMLQLSIRARELAINSSRRVGSAPKRSNMSYNRHT